MPDRIRDTPCYVFSGEDFLKRAEMIKSCLADIPLTFSVKANPFLLNALPGEEMIRHVEVCSPGELSICMKMGIGGRRILYSGVMKEETDIREALKYGADILTAESRRHFKLIEEECRRLKGSSKSDASDGSADGGDGGPDGRHKAPPRILLRLSSGNQFGMSEDDILGILSDRKNSPVSVTGFHYYSGTAKTKVKQIEKDLERLRSLIERAKRETGFYPELIEYGPGLSAEYYEEPYGEKDLSLLKEVSYPIKEFAASYPLGIEMGRFLAAPAGDYYTRVCDLKSNGGVNYVIVDGGVHQLKYYGQNMAMKIPPVEVVQDKEDMPLKDYCICGSLCTVADVLIRQVRLPELKIGDTLVFKRCGAYSVSEGAMAFLSRDLPEIWLDEGGSMKLLRKKRDSWTLNLRSFGLE